MYSSMPLPAFSSSPNACGAPAACRSTITSKIAPRLTRTSLVSRDSDQCIPRTVPRRRLNDTLACATRGSRPFSSNSRAQNVRAKWPRPSARGSGSTSQAPPIGSGWKSISGDGEARPAPHRRGVGPDLPRRRVGGPQVVELLELPVGVHAHPEAVVLEHGQLAVRRQPLERSVLEEQVGLVRQVIEELALEAEEAARHPAVDERRLLGELESPPVVDAHLAVARGGMDAGHGSDAALGPVVLQERADVDRPEPVAVGEHEGVGVDVVAHALEPSAGAGHQARLGKGDLPVLVAAAVVEAGLVAAAELEREVAHLLAVAEEELLDRPALVAQADDEAPEAVVRVDLHDVPQDRLLADLDE